MQNSSDSSVFSGNIEISKSSKENIITIKKQEIDEIIGADIDKLVVSKIFKNLGFITDKSSSDNFVVGIPQYRHDIVNKQDLVEEIVRIVGIDNIPSKAFEFTEENKLKDDYFDYKKRSVFRHRSASNGFFESIHFVFDEKKVLEGYGFDTLKEEFEILNPIVNTLDTLRTTLITGLLKSASNNVKNGYKQVKLFEIGSVFNSLREESLKLSMLLVEKKMVNLY